MRIAPNDTPPRDLQDHARQTMRGDVIWSRLSGGRTNVVWRGQGAAQDWVFKLYDLNRANPLFPNDPEQEAAALKSVSEHAIAPKLRGAIETSRGPCLIYDYTPGDTLPQTNAALITTLARLHSVPPPSPGLRKANYRVGNLIAEGQTYLKASDPDLVRRVQSARPRPIDVPDGPRAFLHGDPTPANAVQDAHQVWLVDWQCPAIGDPAADLAIAFSPAMHLAYGRDPLTGAQEAQLLHAYPDPDTIERYLTLRPYFRWRMAAYCAWKTTMGEAQYRTAIEAELS